ncbi:unnamed protein product [Diabrotica balteata]|uniref:Reverse transcriptase domain-containing protein n=1 Tax=Diabrotica balteata TaxID=107213 RepID=A0A9N9SZD1_DIABA|nr:unnamed protein product [Diabrotica balteata]
MCINGKYLNHLRFANDVLLLATTMEQLQMMISDLEKTSLEKGLKMIPKKTKIMTDTEDRSVITIGGTNIEHVQEYIYLGQAIRADKSIQTKEITRRIRMGWAGFGKLSYTIKNQKIPVKLGTKVFNACVLPVLIYGAQTWTCTKSNLDRIRKLKELWKDKCWEYR